MIAPRSPKVTNNSILMKESPVALEQTLNPFNYFDEICIQLHSVWRDQYCQHAKRALFSLTYSIHDDFTVTLC